MMKNMLRYIAFLLVFATVVAVAACQPTKDDDTTASTTTGDETTTEETTTEETTTQEETTTGAPADPEPPTREEMVEDLVDMNVLAIGDSLFHGDFLEDNQTWIALLAQECDWNLTNLGRDGWTVAYNPGAYPAGSNVRTSIYDKLMNDPNYKYGSSGYYNYGYPASKSNEDVDIILLEGGTNDYGWGIPLGHTFQMTEETYLGALNLIVNELLVRYPNAKVVFVTSWHNTGSKPNGDRMGFVADGMKALLEDNFADNARVDLIDAGNPEVTGVNMADASFRAQYGKSETDVNHLNAEGMKMMATSMLPLIWEVMNK